MPERLPFTGAVSGYNLCVVLTGWKEIAEYLHSGVRTAQRWESKGLPVKRPLRGKRSHVVGDSEEVDSWLRNAAFWRRQDFDELATLERTRRLRQEVHAEREALCLRMQALQKEVAAINAKMKKLRIP